MSPNMPANVFFRLLIVSSPWSPSDSSRAMASTVPGDAGFWGLGGAGCAPGALVCRGRLEKQYN